MRIGRGPWSKLGAMMLALAVLLAGAVVAQDPAPAEKAAAQPKQPANPDPKKAAVKKGRLLRAPGREPVKGVRKAVNPLAAPGEGALAPGQPLPVLGTFRYRFKIIAGDLEPMAASYYPSKLGNTSPAVMLVHERDRSGKDFEESIVDLKKRTLAEDLQKQGYAVLAIDLRGHGSNPRRNLSRSEWASVVADLQVGYHCLVDRHNWGELNVAKFGVIALGEGANVAAQWAFLGGAVSSEGRTTDLGAMILLSPMIDTVAQGLPLKPPITSLAARVPLQILVGERDVASIGLVDDGPASIKAIVKRYRTNQVETFPSALHGYKLLRLEPNLTGSITRFLEGTIKTKPEEWEGRYLLTPVNYSEIKVIANPDRTEEATKKAAP